MYITVQDVKCQLNIFLTGLLNNLTFHPGMMEKNMEENSFVFIS